MTPEEEILAELRFQSEMEWAREALGGLLPNQVKLVAIIALALHRRNDRNKVTERIIESALDDALAVEPEDAKHMVQTAEKMIKSLTGEQLGVVIAEVFAFMIVQGMQVPLEYMVQSAKTSCLSTDRNRGHLN